MKFFTLLAFSFLLISAPSGAKIPTMKMGDPLPSNLFVELAKEVNPSVVFISTTKLPYGGQQRLPRDPLFDLFEQFMGPQGGLPPGYPGGAMPMQALGTGFVIREDGLILTNNHVIEGADKIQVSFKDEKDKPYEATVVGRDQSTDIALIKINRKKPFPVLKLGTSSDVQVGEWVAAFGNPYGHSYTLTVGVVSALGREIDELNRFPFIQTDASINQGNSGGPLVNTRGEVIGVNSAIDARAQGIGFAIPIDNVKSILKELEDTGRVRRSFLGIGMADIGPQAVRGLGLKSDEGVLVMQVEEGSAAARAGVKVYDVITEFNGQKVGSPQELSKKVGNSAINSEIKLKVTRDGKEKTLTAKLGVRDEGAQAQSSKPAKTPTDHQAPHELGFAISTLTAEQAKQFAIEPRFIGRPIVSQVEMGSPAHTGGLQPGDIILDANRKSVASTKQLSAALVSRGPNILRVWRSGQPGLVVIEK